jgi:hypothetical protein
MRRVAWLAFAIVLTFLGATFVDSCPLAGDDCPPACHIGCLDGCSTAPVEATIEAPVSTAVGQPQIAMLSALPLDFASPPDPIPPRA